MAKETRKSDGTKRSPKKIIGTLVIISLLAGTIWSGVVIHRHAMNDPFCESVDPTSCIVKVKVDNDTKSFLVIKQCVDNIPCKSFAQTITLKPGEQFEANGSTDGTPQPWEVFNQQGLLVGCLNLEFTKHQNTPTVLPLTEVQTCAKVENEIANFKKTYHAF